MPSLLDIDHPCAQRQIAGARRVIEVCKSFAFGGDNFFFQLLFPVCWVGESHGLS